MAANCRLKSSDGRLIDTHLRQDSRWRVEQYTQPIQRFQDFQPTGRILVLPIREKFEKGYDTELPYGLIAPCGTAAETKERFHFPQVCREPLSFLSAAAKYTLYGIWLCLRSEHEREIQ